MHLLLFSEDQHDWLRPTPGGSIPISGTGTRAKCAWTRRSGSPEPNGGAPVASSYNVAPSAYRSARWSTDRPVRPVCSGAKYANVPTICVGWLNSGRISANDIARAKSTKHGAPV